MTASANITLPPFKMGAGTPAQNYLAAARGFFLGVEVLSKGSPELVPACAFLASQSLECALKSYLSHTGVSEANLKEPRRRHNLEALWIEASNRGLKVSPQPPDWCVILNQTHDKPYYLRYPIGINAFQTPALAPMESELKVLLGLVEAAVQVREHKSHKRRKLTPKSLKPTRDSSVLFAESEGRSAQFRRYARKGDVYMGLFDKILRNMPGSPKSVAKNMLRIYRSYLA